MAEIKYNDYVISGIDGEFHWEFNGHTYTFSQMFTIYSASYAAQKIATDAMYDKLTKPYKNLKVTIGGAIFLETTIETNVNGFNTKPSVSKVSDDSMGLFTRFIFNITVDVPADQLGAGRYANGLAFITGSTSELSSEVSSVDFSGQWKVLDSDARGAVERYRDQIVATIAVYYLTPIYGLTKWEKMSNDYSFDEENKVITFNITYREQIFNYTTANPGYILESFACTESLGAESIGVFPDDIEGTEGKKLKGSEVVGSDSSTNKPPVPYEISGSISFIKGTYTQATAVSKFKSEILTWVISLAKNIFVTKALTILGVKTTFDPITNNLSFSISAMIIYSSLISFDVSVTDDTAENFNFIPIATSKDYTTLTYTTGRSRSMIVRIMVTTIDTKPTKALLDNLLPEGIDPTKKNEEGWLYISNSRTKTYKKQLNPKVAGSNYHTFYTQGLVSTAIWTIIKVPTKADMRIKKRETGV